MAMYHNGQVQTTTTFGNTQHQLDRDTLTPTQQREQELEEFYAHQQKAMDKRLEMVFRQINNQRENPAAWGRGASMRNMGPLANSEDEAAREKEKVKGDKIDVDELEECLLRLCKMTAKQVDGCSRGPADLPVKPLDQVPYIQDMIWEIDESGDGVVTMHEFKKCYQRAAADETGFEPRKLATLIDFLLMDEEFLGFVTEDQIIELMTARYGERAPPARPPLIDPPAVTVALPVSHRSFACCCRLPAG